MGYYLWQEAEQNPGALIDTAVSRAVKAAHRRNERVVIEAALSTASGRDRDFLQAMAADPGPSAAANIGARTGMRPNAVGNFRTRLIAAGLVEPAGYGLVDFAIPGLREYLTA